MKVAVIGVGAMGRHHVRVYNEIESVTLSAVTDANESLAERPPAWRAGALSRSAAPRSRECRPCNDDPAWIRAWLLPGGAELNPVGAGVPAGPGDRSLDHQSVTILGPRNSLVRAK